MTNFPAGDRAWQISTNGGVWPKWSGEGDELFYFDDDKLMRVAVARGPEIAFDEPRVLFDTSSVGGFGAGSESFQPSLWSDTRWLTVRHRIALE